MLSKNFFFHKKIQHLLTQPASKIETDVLLTYVVSKTCFILNKNQKKNLVLFCDMIFSLNNKSIQLTTV